MHWASCGKVCAARGPRPFSSCFRRMATRARLLATRTCDVPTVGSYRGRPSSTTSTTTTSPSSTACPKSSSSRLAGNSVTSFLTPSQVEWNGFEQSLLAGATTATSCRAHRSTCRLSRLRHPLPLLAPPRARRTTARRSTSMRTGLMPVWTAFTPTSSSHTPQCPVNKHFGAIYGCNCLAFIKQFKNVDQVTCPTVTL